MTVISDFSNPIEKDIFFELADYISSSKVGLEKESLRVLNTSISQHPHPELLGSALCNSYITTDFSEAQIEFVSPPEKDKIKGLGFLEDLHHFVSNNIENEILWPFSIPPNINSEKDILIANYGSSNLGLYKRLYRKGLSHRYGRMMQAISGVHYNYSIPEAFWHSAFFSSISNNPNKARSAAYFNMLRNILRMNWLILYLFGASPIITKCLLTKTDDSLKKLDDQTYYLPYATSLRMSDFGYCNNRRNTLKVSLNSIEEYIEDLRQATITPSSEFDVIDNINADDQQQISANILQIDDEYYAAARAKSESLSDSSTTSKLSQGGVDYIELRSLDLNPYSRIGIDKETKLFVETLLVYCFIKQDQHFIGDEIKDINHNDSIVATKGREPNLCLVKDGKAIGLNEWGKQIIENLFPIAAALDSDEKQYTKAVEQMREKVRDTNLTMSGQLMDQVLSKNLSFIDLGNSIGESNRTHYLNISKSKNGKWGLFEKEAIDSHNQQKILEKDGRESFITFVEKRSKY